MTPLMQHARFLIVVAATLLATVLPARASDILHVEIRGAIFNPAAEILRIAIEQAEASGADAVLLELDTPGGSLGTTKDIVQMILGAKVPVIVYVSPSGGSATSAGTFITLAAHVAAMAPGTTIGAAHPVMAFGGGGEEPDPHMEKKTENYAISFMEAIANQRGRNVEWAVEAVRDSSSITAEAALEKKVIDLIAPSTDALLAAIDGRSVTIGGTESTLQTASPVLRSAEMSRQQRFYFLLSTPSVVFILLLVGAAGLYLEFQNPGMIVPGVVGTICMALALVGFSIVPINSAGLALLLLGMALLAAEVFVPSFGALGVGGLVCLVLGGLLLFDTPEAPGLALPRALLAGTALAFGATMFAVGTLALRSQSVPVASGAESMIGAIGIVRSRLEPAGRVHVVGEIWNAELRDGGSLEESAKIRVVARDRLRLVVIPDDGQRV